MSTTPAPASTLPTTLGEVPFITAAELRARYDVLLLDAYGVLVNADGALPGAVDFITELNESGHPYYILTNDASRLPATCAARYNELGVPIPTELVITSGSLIEGYFRQHGLHESAPRCVVLGPDDAHVTVREAGGHLIEPDEYGVCDAVLICDDEGYDMLPTFDAVVSMLFRSIEQGIEPHLVLPNPDLIYPKGGDRFGVTAGAIALVFEGALDVRYPERKLRFTRLGKPYTAIFESVAERVGDRSVVFVGDQLQTDILGAWRAGIDSVLVSTGISLGGDDTPLDGFAPSYRLAGFAKG